MSDFPNPPPMQVARTSNGMAVASLVLGIISVPTVCIWYVSLPCAILAVVFSRIGKAHAREGAPNGGMATAGFICGLFAIGVYALVLMAALACGVALFSVYSSDGFQEIIEEAARQVEIAATQPTQSQPSSP